MGVLCWLKGLLVRRGQMEKRGDEKGNLPLQLSCSKTDEWARGGMELVD